MNPFYSVDGYKIFHHLMSPTGTSLIYSNLTPRSFKYFPWKIDTCVVFGTTMTFKEISKQFDDYFFSKSKEEVCGEIKEAYSDYSGTDYDVSKIEALHDLGYLPVHVNALPEGTNVPAGVPVLTIYNTLPEFAWVTNFLETMISNLIWKPMTSATLAREFRILNDRWIAKTDKGNTFHSQYGCHDFSMRGLDSVYATISSGLGHALFHHGSDSLPVIHGGKRFYGAKKSVINSIPATEHSIQCAYYNSSDYDYIKTLIERFPTGPLGLVMDGFDLFKAIQEDIVRLKNQIMARTGGPVVIRPDSGNPVDIIAGEELVKDKETFATYSHKATSPENKGVVELLWDIFGGTTNEQGYKVLHPCIRVIYGDSITLERFNEINTRLGAKGFASTNWVAGVGSFTYQFNTRDTLGIAVKSTYQEVTVEDETKGINIFKDPKTDDGTKKSAKGLLCVVYDEEELEKGNHVLKLEDEMAWGDTKVNSLLNPIFIDGTFYHEKDFEELRTVATEALPS